MATAPAWAVPITVRTLCWLNTRSTATASGRCAATSSPSAPVEARAAGAPMSSSAGVRTTSTATSVQRPAGRAVDHADAAPGQAGVDAEHAHAASSRRPEQSFDT